MQTIEKIYGISKQSISETIKLLRLFRGLSQEKFAGLIGKSSSYVSWLETADRSLTIPMLQVISLNLGVKGTVLLYLSIPEKDRDEFKKKVSNLINIEEDIRLSLNVDEMALFELMKARQANKK